MAFEIERKFLVKGTDWKSLQATPIMQTYLFDVNGKSLRVRISGEKAFLTIKAKTGNPMIRNEFEYEIPVEDARQLSALCDHKPIEKIRYGIRHNKKFYWEVDEFIGANAGLVIAEIELGSEDQKFDKPEWLGEEVTNDPRYLNANLYTNPYSKWAQNE